MDRILKVAVVGMGKMGIAHAALLNTMERAHLIGIVDSNTRQLRHVESLGLRVPFCLSLSELCKHETPEALFVCTPPSTHLGIARESLGRGIHTFIEKPLAESLESAQKILALARQSKIVHATGYNLAYVPIYRHVKALLDKFEIGKIERFSAEIYLTKVIDRKQADRGWQFDPKVAGGGVLTNLGSHLLFLLLWYFGDLRSVRGRAEKKLSSRVEDELRAELVFENGIVGDFETSWSVFGYPLSNIRLKIYGNGASMTVDSESILVERRGVEDDASSFSCKQRIHVSDLGSDDIFTLGGEGYYAQDADFLSCIGSGSRPAVSWEEGVKVQEMMDAIYRACENNEVVAVKDR